MAVKQDLIQSNEYIERELRNRLKRIEDCCEADVITCKHPIQNPMDDLIRDSIEDISNKKESLIVILETEGGSIEAAERIANVFRHHYAKSVSFVVPNYAMSAGTILVMSGDQIFMDYYSILGPIDPQIRNINGQYVPALGYLEKYKELVRKSEEGTITQAEMAFFIDKFDPAELFRFEQARQHSVDLLEIWLVKYKFKNWRNTQTRGTLVSEEMKRERARAIADALNDPERWRSHGRGLSIEVIKRDLNLLVEDFGADPSLREMNKRIRSYYRLLQDYMARRGQSIAVHTRSRLVAL